MHFEPDQALDAVARGEALGLFGPVLSQAGDQIAGDAGVEGAVGRCRQQVDGGMFFHLGGGRRKADPGSSPG